MLDFQNILKNGIEISSSGTSGQPKKFFQSPKKIAESNKVAIAAQRLTKDSRVYTCCKLTHAGGLLAQTLPAMSIRATVDIEPFSAYEFVRKIHKYTHTHNTPQHAKAIMLTKAWKDLDLSGIWITCGADPVTWDIIEEFVDKGAIFLANWGMSEVGPIAINTLFDSTEKVQKYKQIAPDNSTILGDTAWCQFKIVENELTVKGTISIYDDWYATGDIVESKDGIFFYRGRKNIIVDLNNPRKG
jgi:acyl-CoA synthetase (AMP-forming)/AMP-acid ligase II